MLDAKARLDDGASGGGRAAAAGRDRPACIASSRAGPGRVLIVLHQAGSTPGAIGQWLHGAGFSLDIRRPALGDGLPETLERHVAAIVFGGPMSANDEDAFLTSERRLIEIALKEQKPCLGICLGGQLMAQVLGAKVYDDPRGGVEIGYYPITPTAAGAALCFWPAQMYQWHREGFDLPRGALLLASSKSVFANQAFVYDRHSVGIQFHPEMTLAMIYRWCTRAADRLELPGAKPRADQVSGHIVYQQQVARWRDEFLRPWIDGRLLAPGDAPMALKIGARTVASLPIS